MLRIISGKYRGRKINQPDLKITRATPDRVKEAIFSSLYKKTKGAIVLDLFSGSGNMAIEALSRGAMTALIVDKNREPINIIRKNMIDLKISNYSLFQMDALNFLRFKKGAKFDLIFIDPPYKNINIYYEVLTQIAINQQLNSKGLIILECENNANIKLPKGLCIYKQKQFNKIKVLFLSKIL